MKRVIFIFLFAIIMGYAPGKAQLFSIAPEVGYIHTSYRTSDTNVSTDGGDGYRIGALVKYNVANGIFMQAGVNYSHVCSGQLNKVNGVAQMPIFVNDVKLKRAEYLTIPFTVGYEFKLPASFGIGLEAGEYIACGLRDGSTLFKCTGQESSGGSLFKHSSFTHYDSDSNKMEPVTINGSDRIDAGLVFGGHIRYRQIRLRATYQLGLVKTIYNIAAPRTFVLSLTYDFKL